MFDCCRSTGFFLLYLKDNEIGEALIHNIDALLDLAKQTMGPAHRRKDVFLRAAARKAFRVSDPSRNMSQFFTITSYKPLCFMKAVLVALEQPSLSPRAVGPRYAWAHR